MDIRMLTLAMLVAGGSACANTPKIARLRTLPLPTVEADEHPQWFDQRVVIRRFDDLRTPEAGESYFHPITHWFVDGYRNEYPDYSRTFSDEKVVRVGGFEHELPFMLAKVLPGGRTRVAEDLAPDATHAFDYVVGGRVLQATSTRRDSVALGMVSILGVPAVFSRQQLRFEIVVTRTGEAEPILRREYRYDQRRTTGLYYNWKADRRLAVDAVTTTLDDAARDIVAAVGRDALRRGVIAQPGT